MDKKIIHIVLDKRSKLTNNKDTLLEQAMGCNPLIIEVKSRYIAKMSAK